MAASFWTTMIAVSSKSKSSSSPSSGSSWVLYLLECVDGSYYAGITTDLARRFAQHLAGKGARYTRARRPRRILASMTFPDRSAASKAEYALKQEKKSEKLAFFTQV